MRLRGWFPPSGASRQPCPTRACGGGRAPLRRTRLGWGSLPARRDHLRGLTHAVPCPGLSLSRFVDRVGYPPRPERRPLPAEHVAEEPYAGRSAVRLLHSVAARDDARAREPSLVTHLLSCGKPRPPSRAVLRVSHLGVLPAPVADPTFPERRRGLLGACGAPRSPRAVAHEALPLAPASLPQAAVPALWEGRSPLAWSPRGTPP